MPTIELKNLTKNFKNDTIFENISLSCSPGQIIGIVGENGAGKSVLFKLIAGFILPNSGSVTVNGANLTSGKIFPPSLGVLIEEPSFLPDITGFENLKLLARIKNEISDEEILQTLEQVNLIKDKDKKS